MPRMRGTDMRTGYISAFIAVAVILLFIDWILGAACAAGLPKIVFLLVNFPFGVIYVWFESHWAGTGYVISGRTVSELWSFVAFFGTVFLQTCLYWSLWLSWDHRYQRRHQTGSA